MTLPEKPPSILVVEDNPTNQRVVTIMLEDRGYRVTTANNGALALELLDADSTGERFDLVLMDCQMPVLDGYQTTEKIRAGVVGENYRQIPIIAITAHAVQGDREKCLALTMNDYLTKPLRGELLQATLQQWLPDNRRSCTPTTKELAGEAIAQQSGDENCCWDRAAFSERLKHREDRMKKLASIFLEDLPHRAAAILQAIDKQETDNLQTLAHSLKGSSATISANSLNQTMKTIEKRLKDGDLMPEGLQQTIQHQVAQLEQELQDFIR